MKNNKKLIVGVFGTANTGKTTMISDIIEATKNREDKNFRWTLFGDDYRKVITERGLKINRNGDEESQIIIHNTLLNNIQNAINEQSLKRIIMDRTIIDSFAYTYWHYRYGSAKINKSVLEHMLYQVEKYALMFDQLLYIPLSYCKNIEVVDDKFRDTDITYREQIDMIMNTISLILMGAGAKVSIIKGDRDERVETFIDVFEYLFDNNNLSIYNLEEFNKVLNYDCR